MSCFRQSTRVAHSQFGTFSVAVLYSTGATSGSIGLGFMAQSLGSDDHRIAKLAQQVKDVLPHVPISVITKDLGTDRF